MTTTVTLHWQFKCIGKLPTPDIIFDEICHQYKNHDFSMKLYMCELEKRLSQRAHKCCIWMLFLHVKFCLIMHINRHIPLCTSDPLSLTISGGFSCHLYSSPKLSSIASTRKMHDTVCLFYFLFFNLASRTFAAKVKTTVDNCWLLTTFLNTSTAPALTCPHYYDILQAWQIVRI